MKKYLIVGLVIFVGGFLLLKPFFEKDEPLIPLKKVSPAIFSFKENLAVIRNKSIIVTIEINKKIKELEVVFNDSIIQHWIEPNKELTFMFDPSLFGVGTKSLELKSTLEDGSVFIDNRLVRVLSELIPEKLIVMELNSYPHLTTSFTQGLEFYNGDLYEGTGDPGNKGKTIVAKVDLKTGNLIEKMGLQAGYFGEGITILNDTLYQITWQNQKCYMYSLANGLQLSGEFDYNGEGWGLCNDGSSVIMSDGTERIVFRNPQSFGIEKTIEVYNNEGPIINLNELEYFDNKIYANVWMTNIIVVINPSTGQVLQQIDATDFVIKNRGLGEALNGIARNPVSSKIYLTGKNWNKVYEVLFTEPRI